jgi:hypothetical protein
MCQIASLFFFVTKAERKHIGDAHDFNNIETQAVQVFFLQGKAPMHIHAILTEMLGEHASCATVKTGWPSVNVMIFAPVMCHILDDPKH